MSFYDAEHSFDEAKRNLDPREDPVMWNLLGGLSEMASALKDLDSEVQRTKHLVESLQR